VRVADERNALTALSQTAGLLHGEEGLTTAGAAAYLDAWQKADGVKDYGLMFGQQVGGVVVTKCPGNNIALR
jgi:hypothetical protein